MDDNLLRPLLSASAATHHHNTIETSLPSNSSIIIRFSTILLIGIISIWANLAASTAFDITVINDIRDFPARNRFNLFYISDDKATRIVQNSTSFIQNIFVNPNLKSTQKRPNIGHVTLRISSVGAGGFTVKKEGTFYELQVNVSVPLIMGDLKKLDVAVKSMVLEGMAWIWVEEGGAGEAPPWVSGGVVEYVKRVAGYGGVGGEFHGGFCLGNWGKDPKCVALFLERCERIEEGFIQRLIDGFRDKWDDPKVEKTFKRCIQQCGMQKSIPI